MDLITFPADAAQWSADARRQGASVGFVPTMGALHEGHIDLVRRALEQCGRVICSIFVNPLQFNDATDLAHYPRQLEQDRALLEAAGCQGLFAPDAADLFAAFEPTQYDLGGLDQHWEGPSRPGHFQGVVNVVERLFHFVRADKAFFGEKDRQQLVILEHVAQRQRWPEHIIGCPTVRAADGLALSSRNARLTPGGREQATILHRALMAARDDAFRSSVQDATAAALTVLGSAPGVELDYFGIAHPVTLSPLTEWQGLDRAIALVAARVGQVRLIDNVTLER